MISMVQTMEFQCSLFHPRLLDVNDYESFNITVTMLCGNSSSEPIYINITNDTQLEDDEIIEIGMMLEDSSPSDTHLANEGTFINITDDDGWFVYDVIS